MAEEFCDAPLLSWLIDQHRTHPHGLINPTIAARICGCGVSAIQHACKRGKIRTLQWKDPTKPGGGRKRWPSILLVPVLDVIQWHAQRPGVVFENHAAWSRYLTTQIALNGRDLEVSGDYVCCRGCGRMKPIKKLGLSSRTQRAESERPNGEEAHEE